METRPKIAHSQIFQETPAFTRLGAIHLLNALGDAFITIALANSVFFSVSVAAARGRIALSLVLTMLPFAVVAPFIGPWIDKNVNKREVVLFLSLLGRAIIAIFIARYLHSWLFFPCAFIALVGSRTYGVIKSALVPHVVADQSQLVEANSKLTVIGVVGGAFGGLVALALFHLLNNSWVVLCMACFLFICAAMSAARFERLKLPVENIQVNEEDAVVSDAISLAATAMSGIRGMVGFITFAVAFALRRQHRSTFDFGLVVAAGLAGSFVGATVAPRLRKIAREERIIEGSLVAVLIASVFALRMHPVQGAMMLTFILGLASNCARMAFDSLIQRESPYARHGKIFAVIEAGLQISWVLGALVPVIVPFPLDTSMAALAMMSAFVVVLYVVGGYATVLRTYVQLRQRHREKNDDETINQ
jgi:MFS family permease